MITHHIAVMTVGFVLDLMFGDPHWMPHPVRAMGWLISHLETRIRGLLPKTPHGERLGGIFLVTGVLLAAGTFSYGILRIAALIHPAVRLAVECFMCYQMLAAKGLRDESMKVRIALKAHDVEAARTAVSMIVGRDTQSLTESGIIKAAVETVAENTSDGVIAPLFYIAFGGAPWAYLYKAVNTMDSMVAYKNERYINFGRTAARLDDLLNFIPARLYALLMIVASFITSLDGRGAIRIYCRDRRSHKSPNSAQTEAVCAGALQVQLAGPAYYFGVLHEKPTIGDDIRPIEADDIARANLLLYMTSILAVMVLSIITW